MAVYEHVETGDRVRPAFGTPYHRMLEASPFYRLVDDEGETSLQPTPASEEGPLATTAAAQRAAELRVDLVQVMGSGAGGRITKGDVERFAASQEPGDGE